MSTYAGGSESWNALPMRDIGRPKVYLTPHELARLTIVRSRLGDSQAEREANAAGRLRSHRRTVMRIVFSIRTHSDPIPD
jgi:hypothetical protein